MTNKIRNLIGAVAAAAMLAATATPAFAGGGHHGGHHGGYHGGYKSGFHGGYRGHQSFRGHGGHHRRGLGTTGAAVLGVMGGLVIGSIIADSQNRHYQQPQPQTVYVPQAQVVAVPEPSYNASLPNAAGQGQCLQTREYQTTVIIGGQPQEAYGTACLQADGSWLKGPMQIVPN